MSQENNSNIDEILEHIKKWPEDMEQDSWNGIPSDRISIYRDIILALEENNVNKMSSNLQSASKSLAICSNKYQAPDIVKLDVDIVMKLTEKLLERAKDIVVDNGVVDTNFIGGMRYLFRSLGDVTNLYSQEEAKITGQDIEKCISLADKVFASSNHIKTNVFVLNNIFSILNNTIYYCNEAVKSESLSKVIEFVETVERDKGIQWDAVTIRSVLWALRSVSERSESLSTNQATRIFNMTNAFVNKIDDLGTLNSTHVCAMLINPLKDMLCKKNNPAKIDVKQCLDLVKQILNKSNAIDAIDDLRLIGAVIDIINYYGKDEENETDIQEYGFGVQNQEIRSFDSNKLKKFVSEKMFDVFEKYLRNKLGAIEVNENVIDNKHRTKVDVEEQKSNLDDDQNKNDDVIEHEHSSTTNVDMPTNNQNSPKVPPEISDDKNNVKSEKKQSMSFDEISDTFVAHTNDLKEEVGKPRVFEDLSNENLPLPQHVRQQTEISDVNSTINNLNLINSNTEAENEKPISDGKIINSDNLGINNDNQFVKTGIQDSTNDFEQPIEKNGNEEFQKNDNKNNETEEVQKREAEYEIATTAWDQTNSVKTSIKEDGSVNKFSHLNVNNQPVQTGNDNKSTKSNSEVNENNKSNETKKHEDEYEPTKMFVILAVLSLFVPFLPGIIFVIADIADNKKKEALLIKVLVFIPVVSPIILWIKTYKAYQANKVLEAKKAIAKAEPSLELYSKTNNFQNIHDMQKRKSEINGEKDESEKSNSTKDISGLSANDAK